MNTLWKFRVHGTPKGQPRPRAFARGGRAAVYDPGTAEGWKSEVAVACRPIAGALLDRPLAVTLAFYLPRPKAHFSTSGQIKPSAPPTYCEKKPDADNLAKAVLDALTSIRAWNDDAQVCSLVVFKYYESAKNGSQKEPPGCLIMIAEIIDLEDEA
jgi:Holliday junction resolvase RusA-like endonuclease